MDYNELLKIISQEYKEILKDNLVGIYLHGSIAFNCFNFENSDIDFIVVINNEITLTEKEDLIKVLLKLDNMAPPKGFEMSVVLKEECKNINYPSKFELHYSNGHKEKAKEDLTEYCSNMNGRDKDLAAHFTIINEVGITYLGEEKDKVFSKVPKDDYLDSIKSDVENATNEIIKNPIYIILNLCRVLAFKNENLILSKKDGGLWGIENVPSVYSRLAEEAYYSYLNDKTFNEDVDLLEGFSNYMINEIFYK